MSNINIELLNHDDLSYDYYEKESPMLSSIKKYGLCATPSDFALANGIEFSNGFSPYWYNSSLKVGYARFVSTSNSFGLADSKNFSIGIRFKLSLSDALSYIRESSVDLDTYFTTGFEYITDVADCESQYNLTMAAKKGLVTKTGKKYTRGIIYDSSSNKYKFDTVDEVYYNGKKYALVELKNDCVLSDKISYTKGEHLWFKVEGIPVIVSKSDNTIVSRDVITSGIPFSYNKCEAIEDSFAYKFLNNLLSNELLPSTEVEKGIFEMPDIDNLERLKIRTVRITSIDLHTLKQEKKISLKDSMGELVQLELQKKKRKIKKMH